MISLQQIPRTRGVVLWEGLSPYNDKNIVVVMTMNSQNRKTGNMPQVWILYADESPVQAKKSGNDESICGDCPHRKGACYVNVGQAPNAVWKAYKAGKYPQATDQDIKNLVKFRAVRLGAYGDPAMVPSEILDRVVESSRGNTGYTHQWRTKFIDPTIQRHTMASVDNVDQYHQAKSEGWRTFRVINKGDELLPNEIFCPATEEGGMKTNCENCLLCSGSKVGSKVKDIAVVVHGSGASKFQGGN